MRYISINALKKLFNIFTIIAENNNMISIICFIIVIFGSMNWLSIGFFQYDFVAGVFGYQGNIFSRLIYIIVGITAIYLVFVIIKNKGRLTVKKLKKEEQPIIDMIMKKDSNIIEEDKQIAKEMLEKEQLKDEIKAEVLENFNTKNSLDNKA